MPKNLHRLRGAIPCVLVGALLSGCASAVSQAVPPAAVAAASSVHSEAVGAATNTASSTPGQPVAGSYVIMATYASLRPAIEETANANTYLAADLYAADPVLQQESRLANTFTMASSLAALKSAGSASPQPAILDYDIEHWSSTPSAEQSNPVGSIASAASIAHSAGLRFETTPDMNFMGFRYLGAAHGCSFSMSAGIVPSVAWANVDMLNLQIERPANSACSPNGNYQALQGWVSQIVTYVRSKNPNIYITAQFSMDEEDAAQAIAAIAAIKSQVDGIYVAYPNDTCANCSESALLSILQSL
jgi:hypothetical protein